MPMETDAKKWLEILSRKRPSFHCFTPVSLSGLHVISVDHGQVICSFLIPAYVTDAEGYWQPGAIATLMDVVGFLAILSDNATMNISVDLAISFLSQAKLHEEVEVEANTIEQKGKLTMVEVHIRKKDNKELVAIGKQWMACLSTRPFKSKL